MFLFRTCYNNRAKTLAVYIYTTLPTIYNFYGGIHSTTLSISKEHVVFRDHPMQQRSHLTPPILFPTTTLLSVCVNCAHLSIQWRCWTRDTSSGRRRSSTSVERRRSSHSSTIPSSWNSTSHFKTLTTSVSRQLSTLHSMWFIPST